MRLLASTLIVLSLIASGAIPASAADGYNTKGARDPGQSSPL
jgi:hypothetical protein